MFGHEVTRLRTTNYSYLTYFYSLTLKKIQYLRSNKHSKHFSHDDDMNVVQIVNQHHHTSQNNCIYVTFSLATKVRLYFNISLTMLCLKEDDVPPQPVSHSQQQCSWQHAGMPEREWCIWQITRFYKVFLNTFSWNRKQFGPVAIHVQSVKLCTPCTASSLKH
jgi:hypothetical protein